MKLSSLHLLLTYQCNFECAHCFVWGSPWQEGTMTLQQIRALIGQALDLGTVQSICVEGGEPFLYYPILLAGVRAMKEAGFRVGVVSNSYWATTVEDALEWLKPLVDVIDDLTISSDLYHFNEQLSRQERHARAAAGRLKIPLDIIQVAEPESMAAHRVAGTLPPGETGVMYRGRAAVELVKRVQLHPWVNYDECPYEDLREPGRVHVDPLGFLHICQGITIGNFKRATLREICETYDPEAHPIVGPLLAGGPAELVRRYQVPCQDVCADACHLCYEARVWLRSRFPKVLLPDQMYGVARS